MQELSKGRKKERRRRNCTRYIKDRRLWEIKYSIIFNLTLTEYSRNKKTIWPSIRCIFFFHERPTSFTFSTNKTKKPFFFIFHFFNFFLRSSTYYFSHLISFSLSATIITIILKFFITFRLNLYFFLFSQRKIEIAVVT